MISVQALTKVYGAVRAVDALSFDVEPGTLTGFLGPNGAGKSTTMRMLLGLDRPTSGTALVSGYQYARMTSPLQQVGALLDASAMHPGRTGRAHLRIAARTHGIPFARVDEVIGQVGLDAAAGRRIKGYSLGMRQRLGIAAALIGDPGVLIFDEPFNGLDLDGVRWLRSRLRRWADEGRTVLISSHLMSEMQVVADRVVVIGRGRLIADLTVEEMIRGLGGARVFVLTPAAETLASAIADIAVLTRIGPGELEVEGITAQQVGDRARALGIAIHHLSDVEQSLEDAYLRLTTGEVEFGNVTNGGNA